MSIFLSKFLPIFVYPLGLACIFLVMTIFVVHRPGWRRVLLVFTFLLLFLGGNRWVALGLARSLEWRYFPPDPIPEGEVIVLLGGGTLSAEYPRSIVEVNGAADRMIYTAWLYHQGKAPHILLSSGNVFEGPQDTPAAQMAELLQMLDVPSDALWLESDSRNTYENAIFSAEILREQGIRRILLVTSASHMPRSVKLFQAQGFEVVPLPTDYTVTVSGWRSLWAGNWETVVLGLFPGADNLALTTRCLKEYLGMIVYSIRGWR